MCPARKDFLLEARKFQDTINATNFQNLFNFLPTNKVAVFNFVKKPYHGLLHHRSEVQLSNLTLMHENLWQETSHSNCPAIYFYMCIPHSITWHGGMRVIYWNKHGLNRVHSEYASISVLWNTVWPVFIYFCAHFKLVVCGQHTYLTAIINELVFNMAAMSNTKNQHKM